MYIILEDFKTQKVRGIYVPKDETESFLNDAFINYNPYAESYELWIGNTGHFQIIRTINGDEIRNYDTIAFEHLRLDLGRTQPFSIKVVKRG